MQHYCSKFGNAEAAAVLPRIEDCVERIADYEARAGCDGFDQVKLIDMKSGCAHRRELLRTDLESKQREALVELIRNERPGLWV